MKQLILAALLLGVSMMEVGCSIEQKTDVSVPKTDSVAIENIKVENYYETGINREYFSTIPHRVVVVGANDTELLLDLGVKDSILTIADGQNNKKYGIKQVNRSAFESLHKIGRKSIFSEHLLQLHPDLIVAQQEFFSKNRLGSTEYWNRKGIYTMVPLNTTSPGKLNQEETIDKEMKYIRDMGNIFHKEERAETIIQTTYGRIRQIREMVANEPKPQVMILDRMSILASYGRKKIAGDMASAIGGIVPDTMAAVSDEQMMKINPDVVFLVVYRDEESELDWIRNKPAYRNLNFIKNHRLYGIPLKYVYGPQTRTVDAIGYMAERMYPGKFHFPKETTF